MLADELHLRACNRKLNGEGGFHATVEFYLILHQAAPKKGLSEHESQSDFRARNGPHIYLKEVWNK